MAAAILIFEKLLYISDNFQPISMKFETGFENIMPECLDTKTEAKSKVQDGDNGHMKLYVTCRRLICLMSDFLQIWNADVGGEVTT